MKRRSILRLSAAIALVGAGLGIGTYWSSLADSGDVLPIPGSVNDPVVTKSYIDKQVADLVKTELTKQGAGQQDGQIVQGGGRTVEVVTVPLTKRLIAKDGAEFIVRAGKAIAYSSDANGISDLTAGDDITNGKAVPNNHLILFPRGGRGIQAADDQKAGLTVLVRGEYELRQQ